MVRRMVKETRKMVERVDVVEEDELMACSKRQSFLGRKVGVMGYGQVAIFYNDATDDGSRKCSR